MADSVIVGYPWNFCSAGVQNCPAVGAVKVVDVNADLNLYVCSG